MRYAVLKGAGYVLVHTPDMVLHSGTTQTTERAVNPQSEYLKNLQGSIRSYEKVLAYPPNQVFIGNMTPEELAAIPFPWYDKPAAVFSPEGRFGEILPEDTFLGLMQVCDAFGLVKLSKSFVEAVKEKFRQHRLLADYAERITGEEMDTIQSLIENAAGETLSVNGETVGCVRRAHDIDVNLSAHVMLENLASKASAVLAFLNLLDKNHLNAKDIDYVIECSEEACGDMNQRGGGNFAKSIAEIAGAVNATGCDTRGFCAAPVHALIEAASLVKAGTFSHVAVVAGGATAKLGMNGKDHVKKGVPILEDVLGGFAALVGPDDGINPLINTDLVGRHTVGTGSAPQAVISSLVSAPLDKAGLKITDVDKFATEMQNPDITKPAGAGDVPEANYKMIAALSVMRKETERAGINAFIERHGIPGYAPTQGHIPSGVPYLGFAREALTGGNMNRIMIVGKGSLFLGRMTNLFDGISIVLERNPGQLEEPAIAQKEALPVKVKRLRIGLTAYGSEHGEAELLAGAQLAKTQNGDFDVQMVGNDESDMYAQMESRLDSGQIDACVTLHYNFPIGVTTIGRLAAPGTGKEMFIASTTGASASDRVEAMILNAVYGIAAAKAVGIASPSVGIVNVDGARTVENALKMLQKNGYSIRFAGSTREDGGVLMRGNDLLRGAADVMITDTLTGNILMKMFSSFTTGGGYESVGYGYGPGLGEDFKRLVLIISRASGAPVVANALKYAAQLAQNGVLSYLRDEIANAKRAGLTEILAALKKNTGASTEKISEPEKPEKEPVTEEITGIDIMQLEDAVKVLWQAGIYAESGMGCAGPVVLVGAGKSTTALKALQEAALISADA